ncbi:DNA repair protein rad50 [Aaosphaeria arxii CBS 175.79]|uniref:DNA repair protein rad50 n=1 Tax=Aaosphaeria arxii CBS 175.79 TaxID=1450172 RepID=A0A6A5XXU2_9PLEO|nr:DNA repair protein rad50 [Aaosphaeria arxii CBS 175.79]KAF2017647.1 DNA repair protein rad50 [Aaosphaeria arxii CBS 175.79]
MSKIDKMSILGIRSFSDKKSQSIHFTGPLTLIVGWNGSGKTTIIECLKYATTGELPPNSKTGGAFIHDPKLAGEKEVMAEVKMSFRSTSGARMVKTTRSQKALEGSLMIHKDGEKTSVSTRYLGVSKAVLENVIFCHQDESLWPMSEPSKYTKAIENIKIIEQHAKEDKDKGDRSEKRQADLYDQITELHDKAETVERQAEEAEIQTKDSFAHAAKFEQVVAQLNGKRITLEANLQSVKSLEHNLKQMAESEEELESMLEKYEERVGVYEKQQETLRAQYAKVKHDQEDIRRSLGLKQSEIGKYEAQKEEHERQIEKRETLVQQGSKRHGIRGYDYEVTGKQAQEFIEILDKLSRDQSRALERARTEAQEELRNAQKAVNQLNERKSALVQSKEISRAQTTSNDAKISGFQRSLDQIKIDEGGEATLNERKQETEKRLKTAIDEAESSRFDARIQEADDIVRNLDITKERLDAELVDATRLARDSAQIDYAQDELKGAKHGLATMTKVHGAKLSELIDSNWDEATLQTSFDQVVDGKGEKVREAEQRRDVAQTKLDKINFRMSSLESDQKKKRSDLQKYEKSVRDAIGQDEISEFDEYLENLERDYEMSTTDQAKFQAQVDYMRSCLKTAQDDDVCRLCRRSLQDNKAQHFSRAGFIASIEGIIDKAQKNAQTIDNVDELFAQLETVRSAKPSYDLAVRLRDLELPAIQSELGEHDGIIHELQSEKQNIESLSKDEQELVKKIQTLTEKQKAAGLSRGIDAIQAELKKISEEARAAKTTLSQHTTEREKSRNLIHNLEVKIRDVNAELSSAQTKLKEKRALADRIEELRTHNNDQWEIIRKNDQEIQSLTPQIEQAEIAYESVERRTSERNNRLQEEASRLSDTVRLLRETDQIINAYIDRKGPQQLARTQAEIQSLNDDLERMDEEILSVTRQVKKIEDTLRDTDNTKRSISDNLHYRKAKASLQGLRSEIRELESQNAENDKERYERDGERWRNEWNRLSTEKAAIYATLKTKDDQLAELIEEWKTEYQDAALKYREAHIKVETTRAAVEDLGRYGGALDKAIMKYHTLKMEEINRIAEELWKNAYQGTDVDTIRIRSDNETAKGNRSYNYRVVMVKQETEMDMRGRCSAGQKVLASIVIRLALAECFGTNCGLIALDEPTTNLDQQNIQGLARSLSEIIKVRRRQANFQLIVITHDEQFLREMNCGDFADIYWRVDRNENQTSKIEQQSISEVV